MYRPATRTASSKNAYLYGELASDRLEEVVNGYQTNSGAMTNYTYHHDALESVLGQSGNTGTVVAAQGYTSFGSAANATGSSNNTLKFTGREQDTETGLYYYRARYYDPITGRFLSEDPIRSGINFYTYCGNNPVNCRDPSGLRWYTGAGTVTNNTEGDITVTGDTYGGADGSVIIPSGQSYNFNYSWLNAIGNAILGSGMNAFKGVLVDPDFVNIPGVGDTKITPYPWNNVIINPPFDGQSGASGTPQPSVFPQSPASKGTSSNPNKTTNPSKTPVGPQSRNASGNSNAANQAANAAAAAVNSAMDAVNSAINPPSVPQAAPTATLTTELLGFGADAADGGFVIYPNMSNTNQIQSVYSKH
jgi:RHS repeat-associated protein